MIANDLHEALKAEGYEPIGPGTPLGIVLETKKLGESGSCKSFARISEIGSEVEWINIDTGHSTIVNSGSFAPPTHWRHLRGGVNRIYHQIAIRPIINDVAAFHRATDTPMFSKPQWPDRSRIKLRHKLVREEYEEFVDALIDRSMSKTADAIADLIYVLVGTALEFGIPLDRVWAEVQRSNMAKVDPATGKVKKREDGKVLKPEGWTPPDIASIMGEPK